MNVLALFATLGTVIVAIISFCVTQVRLARLKLTAEREKRIDEYAHEMELRTHAARQQQVLQQPQV